MDTVEKSESEVDVELCESEQDLLIERLVQWLKLIQSCESCGATLHSMFPNCSDWAVNKSHV